MTILLDIDGVLVTTPAWRRAEIHIDGFLKFDEKAAKNLAKLISETNAGIILTSTHRINYSIDEWERIFNTRGIHPSSISKLNDITTLNNMPDRASEIKEWVDKQVNPQLYVIIDDDLSLNNLPATIKRRCVLTKPMIGLDNEATD